jgi:hypothetical protein
MASHDMQYAANHAASRPTTVKERHGWTGADCSKRRWPTTIRLRSRRGTLMPQSALDVVGAMGLTDGVELVL